MTRESSSPHILLGVTGSIAAYKAADMIRAMQRKGWTVTVVMTQAATRFISPLTLQTLSRNRVYSEMFDAEAEWVPDHIALADRASLVLIAPCTANVMAKLAHGLADDLLTATVLACPAPVVVAPAMNDRMWTHPATQANRRLLEERGVLFVEPSAGDLACGREGQGRLADLETILSTVEEILAHRVKPKGKP
jgi:phosphopantothenoylcysteine decarboxylase/phosphopantothenate--cysteine ligase